MTPRIVSAVASMTAHGQVGASEVTLKRVQDAMRDAVARAQAEGVTDTETLRQLQIEARDKAID